MTTEEDIFEMEVDPIDECREFVVSSVAEVMQTVKKVEKVVEGLEQSIKDIKEDRERTKLEAERQLTQLKNYVEEMKSKSKKIDSLEENMSRVNHFISCENIKEDATATKITKIENSLDVFKKTDVTVQIKQQILEFAQGGLKAIGVPAESDMLCLSDEELSKMAQRTNEETYDKNERTSGIADETEDMQIAPSHNAETSTSKKAEISEKLRKTESESLNNTLVTDYYVLRRSDRKSKSDIQKEKDHDLFQNILTGCEDGLKVEEIENKGRGVMATKKFLRGDFVVEYAGDLISIPEAKERDTKYSKDPTKGCYMYYFQFKNKTHCIDATAESGRLGRLLNHSKYKGNCHTRLIDVRGNPYLIIVASRDINEGEELLYDYGDRSKASVESHPWLKS